MALFQRREEYAAAVAHHEQSETARLAGGGVGRSEFGFNRARQLPLVNGQEFPCSATLRSTCRANPVMTISERIGWDPLSRQIKSWVFDSRGGYGDGALDPTRKSVGHQVDRRLARRSYRIRHPYPHANRPQLGPNEFDRTHNRQAHHFRAGRIHHGPPGSSASGGSHSLIQSDAPRITRRDAC